MSEKFSHEDSLDAPADSTAENIHADPKCRTCVLSLLLLALAESSGKRVGSNFTGFSTKAENRTAAKSN